MWATVGMGIVAAAIVALLSVGGYIMWGQKVWTDGDDLRVRSVDARIRRILWSPPKPLAEQLNSAAHEYEPALSPTGNEMYFVRGTPGENADLYVARRTDDGWADPQPLRALNTSDDELGPKISADGKWLFFYSDRFGGLGMYDIWASQRSDDGWSQPIRLPAPINSPFNDYSPAPSPDGRHLYFSTNRDAARRLEQTEAWRATIRSIGIDDYDLWRAELPDDLATLADDEADPVAAQPLPGVNTRHREGACDISPGGDFIYFTSNRPAGHGGFDLYRARLRDGEAIDIENLGVEINTRANEADPQLGLSGFRLYFSSDRVTDATGTGEAGDDEPRQQYDLFTALSREVFADRDSGALPLGMAWWVLLAALLLALALLWRAGDINANRMSLLTRCLLLSLLLHLLLTILFSVVLLSQQVMEYAREQAGMQIAVNPEVDPEITVQAEVREQLTDLPTPEPKLVEAKPKQTLPEIDLDAFKPRPNALNAPRADMKPMKVTVQPKQPDRIEPTPEPTDLKLPEPSAAIPKPTVRLKQAKPVAAQEPTPDPTPQQPQPRTQRTVDAATPERHLENFAVDAQPLSPKLLTSKVTVRVHERRAEAEESQPQVTPPPAPVQPKIESKPLANAGAIKTDESALTEDATETTSKLAKQEAAAPDAAPGRTTLNIPTTDAMPDTLKVQTALQRKQTVSNDPLAMNLPVTRNSVTVKLPKMAARTTAEDPAITATTVPPRQLQRRPLGAIDTEPKPDRKSLAFDGAPTTDRTPSTTLDAPRGAPQPLTRLALAAGDSPSPNLSVPIMNLGPLKITSPPSLRQRRFEQRQKLVREMGGNKESEEAVAKALAYLKKSQQEDGRWTKFDNDYRRAGRDQHDPAITALATLAFLASDHTPDRSRQYGETVRKGLEYLLKIQKNNGDLRGSGDMYDQGIATLAVAEAAILTNDKRYREAAIKAAEFIVNAQHEGSGGWRYNPRQSGDTSVLGWQVMALHSVEMLGWQMPEDTRNGAVRWLDHVGSGKHKMLAGYQNGRKPTSIMTAEAVFSRIMLGQQLNDAELKEASDYLLKHPPHKGDRNYYYYYYGSLMQMQVQGATWRKWNDMMRDYLVKLQATDGRDAGSWDPKGRWAGRGGRAYSTAMGALTLQVYYRYLPMLGRERSGD